MKRRFFSVVFAAALVIFALVLGNCQPLEEDGYGFIFKYTGGLDMNTWIKILDDVASDGRYITLDLKDCTYVSGNQYAGLIEVTVGGNTYITLDTFPVIRWGKDRVRAIILPDAVQMINQAVDDGALQFTDEDDDDVEYEDKDKSKSVFRYFTNLRSISGTNVTLVGNYAFVDCENLKEINIPRIGQGSGSNVDIGHFAFKGCTSLTEVVFNSAVIIGDYAFKGCTNLKKINFPITTEIGKSAFEGCSNLTDIRFEEAIEIGEEAFKNCAMLRKANFDANDDVNFYEAAFSGCKSLQTLDVRPSSNVYFYDNVLEDTGRTIDIYLYDSSGGYNHMQSRRFLGNGDDVTLQVVNVYVNTPTSNFANSVVSAYPEIEVNILEAAMWD